MARPRRRLVVRLFGALGWIVTIGILAALWPSSLGGRVSYVMVSGTSMEPTMHTGDLAVVVHHSDYKVGDIVAYHVPKGRPGAGYMVIHRVIGGSDADGYKVQGDNRDLPDVWRPGNEDMVGLRWFLVPRVGRLLAHMASPLSIGLFLGALTALLVVTYRPRVEAACGGGVTDDSGLAAARQRPLRRGSRDDRSRGRSPTVARRARCTAALPPRIPDCRIGPGRVRRPRRRRL
jgi:signal peptidase I